jgi:hypothetical protein
MDLYISSKIKFEEKEAEEEVTVSGETMENVNLLHIKFRRFRCYSRIDIQYSEEGS